MALEPTLIVSVRRALHLLDAVGEASRPLPAKALARRAGLPLATTYHLLRTLVHEGYLARIDGAGYVLGEHVATLLDGPASAALRAASSWYSGERLRGRPGWSRSRSRAPRSGSLPSRRTAPFPAKASRAAISRSSSRVGKPTLTTTSSPASVRPGAT